GEGGIADRVEAIDGVLNRYSLVFPRIPITSGAAGTIVAVGLIVPEDPEFGSYQEPYEIVLVGDMSDADYVAAIQGYADHFGYTLDASNDDSVVVSGGEDVYVMPYGESTSPLVGDVVRRAPLTDLDARMNGAE